MIGGPANGTRTGEIYTRIQHARAKTLRYGGEHLGLRSSCSGREWPGANPVAPRVKTLSLHTRLEGLQVRFQEAAQVARGNPL